MSTQGLHIAIEIEGIKNTGPNSWPNIMSVAADIFRDNTISLESKPSTHRAGAILRITAYPNVLDNGWVDRLAVLTELIKPVKRDE